MRGLCVRRFGFKQDALEQLEGLVHGLQTRLVELRLAAVAVWGAAAERAHAVLAQTAENLKRALSMVKIRCPG